jgi:hypothetical protein
MENSQAQWRAQMAETQKEKLKNRYEELRRYDKPTLREIARRNYRIIDLKEADKQTLINLTLTAEFGQKRVEELYATMHAKSRRRTQ